MAYLMVGCADSVTSPADQVSQENETLQHSVFDRTLAGNSGHNRNFRAHLSGDEEVPAVDTRARGQTIFQLSKDGSELSYKLIAANIENITQAHIHCGAAGVNDAEAGRRGSPVDRRVPSVTPELPTQRWRLLLGILQKLPQATMSRGFGHVADLRVPAGLRSMVLGGFARMVGIDLSEAEQPRAGDA
jgi:hypothetical protein